MSSPIHGGPISGTPPRGHVSLSWQVWAGSIYHIWTGNASVPQSLAVVKDNWNSPLSLLPLTCLFISFHPPFSSFPYYHPLFSPFPHHSFTRLPFRTSVPTRLIVRPRRWWGTLVWVSCNRGSQLYNIMWWVSSVLSIPGNIKSTGVKKTKKLSFHTPIIKRRRQVDSPWTTVNPNYAK